MHQISIRGFVVITIVLVTVVFFTLAVSAAASYRSAIEQREQVTNWHLQQLGRAELLRLNFLKHEQEWQRILLRGSSSNNYYQHLSKFYSIERNIRIQIMELKKSLDPGNPPIKILTDFEKMFFQLGRIYRKALHAYNESLETPHLVADEITQQASILPNERIIAFIHALEESRQKSYAHINQNIARTELIVGILIVLLLPVLALLIYHFSNQRVIRPILSTTTMAKNISAGDLQSRAETPKATLEVQQLIQALEIMQENIKSSRDELIMAKEDAEKSNEAKSEFLSRMSHELRTPLNAILGFGQLLQYTDKELSNEQAESLDEIVKAGQHLLSLINEILDLSRIEQNKLEISREDVQLSDVVSDCISLTAPLVNSRGLTLHNRISEASNYHIEADFTRLKQSLLNFISNAIKYNSESGRIDISCSESGEDKLRIQIADTGLGIPEDQMHLLFQPFERIDNNTFAEGAGIGLALTKQLVELMGGTIGVESEVGKGSTFWMELQRLHITGDSKPSSDQEKATIAHLPMQASDKHDYTVLYVEDNPSNTRLVTSLLKPRQDIHLITAHTGRLGLDMAIAYKPDLILLDIQLPEMDGYQVFKALQENSLTKEIPTIAISANAMKSDIDKGHAAGFLDYLTKPLDIPGFNDLISQQLPIQ